jgi:hypothetical protein
MVAGLEDITAGDIYIDDKVVNHLPPKDRGQIFLLLPGLRHLGKELPDLFFQFFELFIQYSLPLLPHHPDASLSLST